MEKEEILRRFQDFIKGYDEAKSRETWEKQSSSFREFWKNRIMLGNASPLTDSEIDEIVLILDSKARGKADHPEIVPIAMSMNPQGAWIKLFKELQKSEKLKTLLDDIFFGEGEEIIPSINELYSVNENKNRLTGRSANTINTLLFAFNPKYYISAISLNDREKIINYFNFDGPNLERDSPGTKVVKSNECIIEGFRSLEITSDPRTISDFLYSIKELWKGTLNEILEERAYEQDLPEEKIEEDIKVLEEEIYQKLIHRNFGRLFPGLEYSDPDHQNKHNGHLTTYGRDEADFVAKDEKGDFVVIELKVSTSDKALGQIQRYMGWVKRHLCKNGEEVKGIIVGENDDPRLEYALLVAKDIEFKKIKLDIHINESETKNI
ncbi:MAG: DUF91 domain-containing protein [Nanoarchaeota archaeon]|nr:DUF91 domain-containing protein [Nanoarchaeota archaeon]